MGFLTYLKIAGAAALVAMVIGFFVHYQGLKSDLEITHANLVISEQNTAKAKLAVITQRETLASVRVQFKEVRGSLEELRDEEARQDEVITDLRRRLTVTAGGRSRDIGKLALARPKTIQKIINKATVNVNRCFELATGAELREGERNSECPDLIAVFSR